MPGAQRPPHGDNQGHSGRDAELLPRKFPGVRTESVTNRGPGYAQILNRGIMPGAFFVTQKHTADMTGQHLSREARYGIAFMNQRRDAELGRLMQHRIADIAAGSKHGVGPEFLQNPARLMAGVNHILQRIQIVADVFQMMPAAQIGHLQRQNAEAFARNQIHFHFPLGAEE